MCRFKSAIILKDNIFVPDYDSHANMLKALKITEANAEKTIVRAELYPEDGDEFSEINTWKFSVNQDILPDWYDEEHDKQRMIEAVKEWARNRIHTGERHLNISYGGGHRIKDCENVSVGGIARVKSILDSTVKTINGSARVEYIGGNTAVGCIAGNARIKDICDDTGVLFIYEEATIQYIFDNASVEEISSDATVEYIYGNVAIGTISGEAKIEHICDNTTVASVRGESTIKDATDNAIIEEISGEAKIEHILGQATIITSPNAKRKWKKLAQTRISGDAMIKDNSSKTIYQSGGWTLKEVKK